MNDCVDVVLLTIKAIVILLTIIGVGYALAQLPAQYLRVVIAVLYGIGATFMELTIAAMNGIHYPKDGEYQARERRREYLACVGILLVINTFVFYLLMGGI